MHTESRKITTMRSILSLLTSRTKTNESIISFSYYVDILFIICIDHMRLEELYTENIII